MLTVALVACSDTPSSPPPPPPNPLPALSAGAWYVHEAEGQVLPAMIAHRLVDGVLEQTFLDSSSLQINADGSWQQLIFKRRALIGTPALVEEAAASDVSEPVVDHGSWVVTDSAYLFTSVTRARQFVIRSPSPDSLALMQKLVDHAESGLVRSVFRRTRPLTPLSGTWWADRGRGAPLPLLVESIPTIEDGGRAFSWHVFLDSARVELGPDKRYELRSYVSGWEGEVNGPPVSRMSRSTLLDRGIWNRSGSAVTLESLVYGSHVLHGFVAANGALVINHGVEMFDPNPFPVVYWRQ